MKRRCWRISLAIAVAVALTGFAETVTNVRGIQRENSNLVDIYYDLNDADGGSYTVEIALEGRTNDVTAATFTGDVGEGVSPGKNKRIVWDAGADWPDRKGDIKAIITSTKRDLKHKSVQLWAGGPYWADRNVGASSPEDAGLYFWWGDTTGHRPSGTTFSFSFSSSNCPTYGKTPATLQSEGWVVSKNGTYMLAPSHDAAHVKWGGSWRMPTYQELYDLCYTYCDWTWTTRNGVNGYLVRGRGSYADNSIFLPASGYGYGTQLYYSGSFGYYWSSVPDSDYNYSWYLYFGSGDHGMYGYNLLYSGFSVRPVQGFTN